jgi:hypothetical protein
MKRIIVLLVAFAVIALVALLSCGDKGTPEACQYETSMNLDAGSYDAVLQSPCATSMQLAAAHFGRAGYDSRDVINRLIDAKVSAGQHDLGFYMSSLIRTVTLTSLGDLESAESLYASIGPSTDEYRDAQFLLGTVRAIKALALIKTLMDALGAGTLSSCDINGNGVIDQADALSCALQAGVLPDPVSGSCLVTTSTATWNATSDIIFSGLTGTYRGLTVSLASAPTASCQADYRKLLYSNPATTTYDVALTTGTCEALAAAGRTDAGAWPCPVTSSIDFLAAFQANINGAVDALSTSLTGTGVTTSDVQQAILDIQSEACGTDGICTGTELSDYIQSHM